MTALAVQTIQKTNQTANPPTILQRVADRDQTVIKDCIDNYGNFIWALARKFTNSTEEAEAATQEIFTDIWRYAERIDSKQYDENVLIGLIAKRRLIRHLQ
jgi:RNA polymerase sigma-70 factor (ECF subfamily)